MVLCIYVFMVLRISFQCKRLIARSENESVFIKEKAAAGMKAFS